MLYSVSATPSAERMMIDTIFTEPVFLLLILLIPAGIYLLKKDLIAAKLIGILSIASGCIYLVSRVMYNL